MKRPDFPLSEAIGWFLSDAVGRNNRPLEPGTLRRYRGNLAKFLESLPAEQRILSSLTCELVDRWAKRTSHNEHTRMNRLIALKSFARYLAEQKLWFEGPLDHPYSVLRGLRQPQPDPRGTPAFTDDEVTRIVRNIPETGTRLRTLAIIAVELHGFRAKEVRTMLRKNVVWPMRGETHGAFLVERREHTKNWDSLREIPMDPDAVDAIKRYIRHERPEWKGEGDEPLFIKENGEAFTESGFGQIARRLKAQLSGENIEFKQHRFRSWRTRNLHENGTPDSTTIETMGWSIDSGPKMLRRYVGRISLRTLKAQTPRTLARVLGRA